MHSHDATGLTPRSITTTSAEETEAFGESLARALAPGDVVLLTGDLGAGKTTFVRGLHRGLRCRGRTRSPSYTTLNVYEGDPPLHHFDLFRYEAVGPAFLDEFAPWLEGDGIVVVEWPERMGEHRPAERVDVDIRVVDDTTRALTVTATGGASARVAAWGNAEGGSA